MTRKNLEAWIIYENHFEPACEEKRTKEAIIVRRILTKISSEIEQEVNLKKKVQAKKNKKKLVKSQFKIFKKELHLPSPFAKTVNLFGQISPDFAFLFIRVRTGRTGLNTNGFWRMEVFGLAGNSN